MIGPIANSVTIILGGIVGSLFGRNISKESQRNLNLMFGCIALGIGVTMIARGVDIPAIVLSVLFGTMFGISIKLEDRIMGFCFKAVDLIQRKPKSKKTTSDTVQANTVQDGTTQADTTQADTAQADITQDAASPQQKAEEHQEPQGAEIPQVSMRDQFAVGTVIFCVSGLGFIGSMEEGMTGDPSLLIVKATLDGITSFLFASNVGSCIGILALPQFLVQTTVLLAASAIYPLTTPDMLANFSACGGFIMLGAGMRQFGIVPVPVLCMLPSLLVVMPLTALWDKLL